MRLLRNRLTWANAASRVRRWASAAAALGLLATQPASAVVIELKDVASDRVERQRAEAIGQLPLPGTPNVGQLSERLAEKKMAMGNPILIRVFKASSELEVWMQTGEKYELFATYPICNWSGTLGPKLTEGDKQSPEGVYTVTARQLHLIGRHPRSLNLGFPNALDRQMSRTGSYILIHGGCSSVGCFAMTNPVIEEVYSLALAALNKGKQDALQVHVFPFRMTEERLTAYALNEWYDFWRNLKDVSDSFERTHLPPKITICEGRYWVEDGANSQEVAAHGPLAVCAVSLGEAASLSEPGDVESSPPVRRWPLRAMLHPALVRSLPSAPMLHNPQGRSRQAAQWLGLSHARLLSQLDPRNHGGPFAPPLTPTEMLQLAKHERSVGPIAAHNLRAKASPTPTIPCSISRSSCRHWLALATTKLQAKRLHVSRTARTPARRG